MLAALDHLADRIGQLAQLTQNLREENHSLRAALDENKVETRALKARIDAARSRIEVLLDKLPGDPEV